MISPYAARGYIDHQTLSFDAYVKFIEDDFLGGQRLDPATDGRPDPRPDVRENAPILGNLTSDFDFNQKPRPPADPAPTPDTGHPSTDPCQGDEVTGTITSLSSGSLDLQSPPPARATPTCEAKPSPSQSRPQPRSLPTATRLPPPASMPARRSHSESEASWPLHRQPDPAPEPVGSAGCLFNIGPLVNLEPETRVPGRVWLDTCLTHASQTRSSKGIAEGPHHRVRPG